MQNAPDFGGVSTRYRCLGGLSLFDHLRLAPADLDLARLGRLGHLVDEVDMQHAVDQAGANDLDVVGEAEAPLERAPGDAAVQITAPLLLPFRLPRPPNRLLITAT